jgi:hypothetical protein
MRINEGLREFNPFLVSEDDDLKEGRSWLILDLEEYEFRSGDLQDCLKWICLIANDCHSDDDDFRNENNVIEDQWREIEFVGKIGIDDCSRSMFISRPVRSLS